MKITKIQLKNYRAFYATHTIDTNNKNLLIYGENGSGKTSLYQSIVDFFVVTEKGLTDLPFNKNHWNKLSTSPEKEIIKIDFDDNSTVEFTPNAATPKSNADFERIAKQSPFYTYKRILKTYISDESVERQLLLLLVEEIVATYVDTEGKSILDYWNTLKTLSEIKGKPTPTITAQQAEMTEFTKSLATIVGDLVNQLNDFLDKYFHTNIHLTITTPIFTNIHKKIKDIRDGAKQSLENATVQIKVKFFDEEIENHTDFLNEARLSALAICMYLASLKVIPAPLNLKILFLDDIFIGLDMSNRLPLLAILKNEFSGYQIFMTTYDRAWFEVAKQWFENKAKGDWKFFEMYVDDFTNPFDVPVVLGTKTFMQLAFYHQAQFDYPASANYLRKAVEELLDKKFKGEYNLILKGSDGLDLGELDRKLRAVIKFLEQIDALSFKSDFQSISIYAQSLMNPLSHYDLTAPVFKEELQTIRTSLEYLDNNLPDFSKTKMLGDKTLERGNEVTLQLKIDANTENHYFFTLQENVLGCKASSNGYLTNSSVCSSECLEIINRAKQERKKFAVHKNPISFENVLKKIVEFENENNPKLLSNKLPLPNWKEVFYNSEGRTLQELINDL